MQTVELIFAFREIVVSALQTKISLSIFIKESGRQLELCVRGSDNGFDVGAKVETYGLYPWAGSWHGAPWEPTANWSSEALCREFLGLMRMLLSPDGRLRIRLRNGKPASILVELRSTDGWRVFEKLSLYRLPLGNREERIVQNTLLPSRWPFGGLSQTELGIYHWSIAGGGT